MKSGFIAIIGKPNVGKSSLMNAIIGEKVSIVSPKAQTTRDRILGILTEDDCQMIFVDTPGIHAPKTELGRFMNDAVRSGASGADAILIVIDATKRFDEGEIEFIQKYLMRKTPVYLAINKSDLAGYNKIYPILTKLSFLMQADGKRRAIKEVIPTSAKTGENVVKLRDFLKASLPEGELLYPEDEITDKPLRYMICETVREKTLYFLQEEIPHGVGVFIQTYTDSGKLVSIDADIVCEKSSHKMIIIGDEGAKLRQIGESARLDIEKLVGKKVFLKLFVKVRENWRNKKSILNDMGYE